jgi:hypothetical protein
MRAFFTQRFALHVPAGPESSHETSPTLSDRHRGERESEQHDNHAV